MKVVADTTLCQEHGQCVFAVPEVFELTDDAGIRYGPGPGPQQRSAALAAVQPVRCR